MHMRKFLEAVASGDAGLDAASESVTDLAAFQPVVKVAEEAYSLGYIDFFKPHRESYSGHRFVDAILASGLTEAGREYLDGA